MWTSTPHQTNLHSGPAAIRPIFGIRHERGPKMSNCRVVGNWEVSACLGLEPRYVRMAGNAVVTMSVLFTRMAGDALSEAFGLVGFALLALCVVVFVLAMFLRPAKRKELLHWLGRKLIN